MNLSDLKDLESRYAMDTYARAPVEFVRTLAEFAREHGYPFVLKPATGTGGSRGLKIVTD